MSRQARFEIVRTDAGWHGRFRAANGRVLWTTEVYTRSRAALHAVIALTYNMGNWAPIPETVLRDERIDVTP